MRHHSSLVEIGQLWVSVAHTQYNHTFQLDEILLLILLLFCACLLLLCSCRFQGNLHDRYGQLVVLYTKLLCTKMEFHIKVRASCVIYHIIRYDTKIHVIDDSAKC